MKNQHTNAADIRLGSFVHFQGKVDAIICDPPCGNFYGSQRKKIKTALVDGDDMEWLGEFVEWSYRVCCVGPIIMFCDRHHRSNIEMAMKTQGNFINDAIWFKKPWGIGYNFRPAHEHILLFSKSKSIKASHFSLSSVLLANKVGKKFHPTEKPVSLMKQLIEGLTKPGQTVLDPFMGSGSVGVACVETGRKFIGIDIVDEYVKHATQRIEAANNVHS